MNIGEKRVNSVIEPVEGKNETKKPTFSEINHVESSMIGINLSEITRKEKISRLNHPSNIKKYRVIDLFSGCGGISEGFSQTGRCDIIGSIDLDESACKTFKYNFPNAKVIYGDINEISVEDTGFSEVDILVGGPPCQGFSALNRHSKSLENDPRNRLFFQFIRFVEELKPKAIFIENVRQILSQKDGYARKKICNLLEALGYQTEYRLLDASDYGVPQKRIRAVFVGIRNDLGNLDFKEIEKFKIANKTTVKEALQDLYSLEQKIHSDSENDIYSLDSSITNDYLRNIKDSTGLIFNHRINYPNNKVQQRIKCVPPGGNWRDVPEYLFPSHRDNRHSNYLKRIDENSQSITIDTGHAVYFHPTFNRVPTTRESARLQSFPDGFIFIGNKGEQLRQVGNAVPPLMAKAIAQMILEVLDNEKKHDNC